MEYIEEYKSIDSLKKNKLGLSVIVNNDGSSAAPYLGRLILPKQGAGWKF